MNPVNGETPLKVVALMGISHCGSTLLNLMLDTHPAIYGGGELQHLFLDDNQNECTNCGADCPHWTPQRIASMRHRDFYRTLADMFGVNVVVDTSKTWLWFSHASRYYSSRPLEFIPAVMIRDPVAHTASLVMHLVSRNLSPEDEQRLYAHQDSRIHAIRSAVYDRILKDYQLIFTGLPKIFGRKRVHILRYEQVVTNPRAELTNLFADVGVPYDPIITQCYQYPHHQMAGNRGALYQYHKQEDGIQGAEGLRADFY